MKQQSYVRPKRSSHCERALFLWTWAYAVLNSWLPYSASLRIEEGKNQVFSALKTLPIPSWDSDEDDEISIHHHPRRKMYCSTVSVCLLLAGLLARSLACSFPLYSHHKVAPRALVSIQLLIASTIRLLNGEGLCREALDSRSNDRVIRRYPSNRRSLYSSQLALHFVSLVWFQTD